MKYNYVNEQDLPISTTVTLYEIDSLVKILEPISEDKEHAMRWKAGELIRSLKEIRRSALGSASSQMKYEHDKMVQESGSDAGF